MYVYSLEDKLLAVDNKAELWKINSDDVVLIQSQIDNFSKIVDEQTNYRKDIDHITIELGNVNYTADQRQGITAERDRLSSLLIPDDELQNIKDELTQLNQRSSNYRLSIDVHNNLRTKGFYNGVYKVNYRLLKDLVTDCFIETISSDRKSIKVKLKNIHSESGRLSLYNFFQIM
jgi:hypothetical protein